ALNIVSNMSWGRNMTGHLIVAFTPTVWSGKEPFPVGATGMTLFAGGTLGLVLLLVSRLRLAGARSPFRSRKLRVGVVLVAILLFGGTLAWAIGGRDNLYWKQELVSSFFRPEGFAFEPTARRQMVAERDAALRAGYTRPAATGRRKNVVLIIV